MATNEVSKNSQKNSSSKRKYLKIGGIVAGAFLVLLILVGIFADTVPTYSMSDLVMETEGKVSFSRPKQWQDVSNIDKVKNDFGLNVGNASAFGDKIVKDKDGKQDIANAFVIFGQASNSETIDVNVFKQPDAKAAFEKAMDSQLQADNFKSDECQSIVNYSKNFNYDLDNFPVSVALNFNCQLSEAEKKNQNADSIEVRLALAIANDGKTYVYALVANDKSWAKNEQVYFQMLKDFKSKP